MSDGMYSIATMGGRIRAWATSKAKEMPDRKWPWSVGQQAELFAIGLIRSSMLKDVNELNKEWHITDNNFRLVPVQWDFVTSAKGENTEGMFDWLNFSGDIREPSTRFASMLVAFANAKRCGVDVSGHDDTTNFVTLAMWFAGTNWFIQYSLDDAKVAERALEQAAGGTIQIDVMVEDYENVALNSYRLKNTKKWKNQKPVEMIAYYMDMVFENNKQIRYGDFLKPYIPLVASTRHYGILNHEMFGIVVDDDTIFSIRP